MNERIERLGEGVTLYLGDSHGLREEIAKTERLAVVCDPPYGQRHQTNVALKGGTKTSNGVYRINNRRRVEGQKGGTVLANVWPDGIVGDDQPFDPAPWLDITPHCLFWGAHRFADRLPAGSWLIWDKVPTGKIRDQGDGEAAWVAGKPKPLRIYRLLWDGVCVGGPARHEVTAGQQRVHPTQKPVVLMEWCLRQMALEEGHHTVVDPYMGSGSTGIAAVKLGYRFVGMEIVPQYFDTACRRITEALKQPRDLFIEALPPAKRQEAFDL